MNHAEFFLIGATHRTASLGLRERLSLSTEAETAFSRELDDMTGLLEFALLNTCNRVEIYGVATDPQTIVQVETAFCQRQRFDLGEFKHLRLDLRGADAVQHLLEVSAGLDSQMLGENEIFGQVKKAYANAQTCGSAGAILNRVFQKTFQAAKHVRTHTAITAGLVSVANVAVDLAQRIFGDLTDARILLLGAGDIGTKSGRAFQSRGAASMVITSRRLDRAAEVAAELGTKAAPFDHCLSRLEDYDVIVCSTAAPGTVISRDQVIAAMTRRQGRPLFLIDLALPRDVDESVAGVPNVFLYNLDDLAKIAAENRTARQGEITRCRCLLTGRAEALWFQVARQLTAVKNTTAAETVNEPALPSLIGAGFGIAV